MIRHIHILIGETLWRAGTAVMRGDQLADILRPAAEAEGFQVSVTRGLTEIRDAAVIMNKTAITEYGAGGVEQLLSWGNRVFLDILDGPDWKTILPLAHGLVSSSFLQHERFRQRYPDKPVVYIPHHANPRLESVRVDTSTFRCGYFGSAEGAVFLPELAEAGIVDTIIAISRSADWIPRFADYSIHYAVRPARFLPSVLKPFTKGATAGACGVPVIVCASDTEARRRLGDDYPYYAPADTDLRGMIDFLAEVRESFGGPRWQHALKVMESVREEASPAHIRDLFRRDFLRSGLLAGLETVAGP